MKYNKKLILLFIIGLIASGVLVWQRFDVESYYKNYEVDFYYSDLEKLAQQEGKSIDQYLDMMKDTGVMNMFIREETIQSMKQSPDYDLETRMSGYDMIIESPDEDLIQWIYNGYNNVKKSEREVILEDKNTIRVVGESYEQITAPVLTIGNYGQRNITTQVWEGSMLETVGLGYSQKAIEKTLAHGYGVILAPTYNGDFQDADKSIDRYFSVLDQNKISPSHIFFTGLNVVGYDPYKDKDEDGRTPAMIKLGKELEDRSIALGFIESSSQGGYLETKGMEELADIMQYEATGNYLTWDFIQNKFDYGIPGHHNGEEITNIFFRGITTRNIRIIALKPFVKNERYIAEPEAYKNVLDNLAKRLSVHGIKPGKLKTMEYFDPNPILKALSGLGILAAGLMILDNLFTVGKKTRYVLMGLAAAGLLLVYIGPLAGLEGLMSKALALVGAMVMPVIALFVLTFTLREIYKDSVKPSKTKSYLYALRLLVVLTLLCLGSVMFEIAMLAHSKYLLGLDAFAGVKLSQMIPMLMAPVVYVAYNGYKRGHRPNSVGITQGDAQRFFTDSIKIWQVIILGGALGVILVFMARSGNTSGEPSIIESLLRNSLEYVFPARPRTKAIFVGIPALIVAVYNAYQGRLQKVSWLLIFVSSIGFVNTVNTFSHMKAPIYLSLYRTGAELLVGALVGLVIIGLQELLIKRYNTKNRKKKTINE